MKQIVNKMELSFPSRSVNEAFARGAVTSFVLSLDPLVTELNDLKTAVSEAVTNAIVHGYRDTIGTVYITGGEERAGLGFAVMQSFCDRVRVSSAPGRGTTVTLTKQFAPRNDGE